MVGVMVAASTIAFIPIGWQIAGPVFLFSMVIAAGNALIVGLNFCELALQYPRASSFVDYFENAFGAWAGISFTLLYVVVLTLAGGGAFVVIGLFFTELWPVLPWWVWSLMFYGALLGVNIAGVEIFGWTQFAMTGAMIGSLIVLSFLALSNLTWIEPDFSAMVPLIPDDLNIVFYGALFAVWLFVGFEVTGPLVEEIKSPRRILPLALIASIVTIFVTKGLFFVAEVTTTADMDTLVGIPGPQIIVGGLLLGSFGIVWLTLVSIIAEGSSVNAAIGALGRLLYVLARVGALPRYLARLHPRLQTPVISLLLIAALMVMLGLAAGPDHFLDLFLLATFTWLITYFLFCLAVIVLRWRRPDNPRPFSVGGPRRFPLLSCIGLTIMILIFVYSPESLSYQGLTVLALCCTYGIVVHRRRIRLGKQITTST